ncbi:hypothetical protein N0V93_003694 [Gnomoniopsis smithogilvyi]|uniref:Uncharacterized protein n=1 Tax=Gnomoniopsis smithogilvyi TaxID=1191159 RepID=A0A9W8YYZ1_9PEZI|nr:hypothetical protein N0V93_003694 [Gnomoniopsis smithogilvyi]
MMRKFKKGLRADKEKSKTEASTGLEPGYCHACGQRTPNRSTFGSFSSRSGDRGSWAGFSTSDSGYESLDGGKSQISDSPLDENVSIISFKPPTRQQTYSSSVYSSDIPTLETLEPFPMMEELVEENDDDLFELPPQSPNNYSRHLSPPKSRFARLNDLPAASPRALMFPDDVFDMDAGIEIEEPKGKLKHRRSRWSKGGSLSSIVFPAKLRKLSKGNDTRED